MNVQGETAGQARSKIFCSLVMTEGTIKRGVLISRMHITTQTFVTEYKDYLDQYPAIQYDKKTREFSFEP